jgi:hypothetical protein
MVEVVRLRRKPGAVPPSRVTAVKRPMSRTEIAQEVAAIKEMGRRLRPPLNERPHAFHEDKSDLVRALELLEDAVRGDRQLTPETGERKRYGQTGRC